MPNPKKGELSTLLSGGYTQRVLVGPGRRRLSLRLVGCASEEEAERRKQEIAIVASRYRSAGRYEEGEKVVCHLAASASATVRLALLDDARANLGGTLELVAPVVATSHAFRQVCEWWTSGELHRRYPDHVKLKESVQDDIERLEKHVYPLVGHIPIADFRRAHADLVMSSLPSGLSPGSRRHVAQLVQRILRLSHFCEYIPSVPLPPAWLPKLPPAEKLDKVCPRPSEEAAFLAATDVPCVYRLGFGFMHREGPRCGNIEKLVWKNLSLDRVNGEIELEKTKSGRTLSWVLRPDVARALVLWKKQVPHGPEDPVFPGFGGRLAEKFRRYLKKAGVTREQLFTKRENKLALRAHDARAFFVTSSLYLGKDESYVRDRTGHRSAVMVDRYKRDVRKWRELGEGAPVDLDVGIPEFVALGHQTPPSPSGENGGGWKGDLEAPLTAGDHAKKVSHEPKWRNGRRSGFKNPCAPSKSPGSSGETGSRESGKSAETGLNESAAGPSTGSSDDLAAELSVLLGVPLDELQAALVAVKRRRA